MIVIVKENNGKIELTKEELEAIIEEAKAEGRKEVTIVSPYSPYPSTIPLPYSLYYTITC